MNVIQEATKECPRDDCSITNSGMGVSTCLGWTPSYDKLGNRTDRGDPNTHSSELRCSRCGQRWTVVRKYDETKITAQHPWPTPTI